MAKIDYIAERQLDAEIDQKIERIKSIAKQCGLDLWKFEVVEKWQGDAVIGECIVFSIGCGITSFDTLNEVYAYFCAMHDIHWHNLKIKKRGY